MFGLSAERVCTVVGEKELERGVDWVARVEVNRESGEEMDG